jgi:hypothetical protein
MVARESSIDALLHRVRSEYLEMPGQRLTLAQAARLWNLDRTTCGRVLHTLTLQKFLARTVAGTYVRWDSLERSREPDHVTPDHRAIATDPSQS